MNAERAFEQLTRFARSVGWTALSIEVTGPGFGVPMVVFDHGKISLGTILQFAREP